MLVFPILAKLADLHGQSGRVEGTSIGDYLDLALDDRVQTVLELLVEPIFVALGMVLLHGYGIPSDIHLGQPVSCG